MSIVQQTTSSMRQLRLSAMAATYELQLEQPKINQMGFDERLALLFQAELGARDSRKLNRLVHAAKLPEAASLEDVDSRPSRGLDKALLQSLSNCNWIRKQQNIFIVGPTGVGKTWIACALADQACRLRMPAVFYRASDLFSLISDATHDGSLSKLKLALCKPDLLIVDDFGIGEMAMGTAQVLLEVIDRRERTGSLIVTSQWPTEKWHSFFPDPTIADAVLDRIVHQAHRVQLKGESMRKLRGKAKLAETLTT